MPNTDAPPATVANFVQNPLDGWGNDDLLFDPATRAFIGEHHPAALPVLDWPELRARFAAYDGPAGVARKRSRQGGVRAAILGFAALVIGALSPLIAAFTRGGLGNALGGVAALLAVGASVWGYGALLTGRRKAEWLTNRLFTERLRQLYFQFTLNHLPLAVAVMRDPARRAEWDAERDAALDAFDRRIVRAPTAAFESVAQDEAEEEFWIDPEWAGNPPPPPASPELDTLFALLAEQRFEIQRRFTGLKLRHGFHSVDLRGKAARGTADALTLVVLAITAVSGALLAFGGTPGSLPLILLTAAVGVCSALILLLRVLNEGLQLSAEAERYRWYRAAVSALARRFADAPAERRVGLLRDMERLSYQEMRWFLTGFDAAKFVM